MITHSGYLFKRSNRPRQQQQQLGLFPLDSLEIPVATTTKRATTHATAKTKNKIVDNNDAGQATTGMAAQLAPRLNPKPVSMGEEGDTYSSGFHAMLNNINNNENKNQQYHQHQQSSNQQTRPLHLPHPDDPITSLTNKFNQAQQQQQQNEQPELIPLARPSAEITESISTKATSENLEDLLLRSPGDESSESSSSRANNNANRSKRQLALEQSLNCAAAFFGIYVEDAFSPLPPPPPLQGRAVRSVTASPPTTAITTTFSQLGQHSDYSNQGSAFTNGDKPISTAATTTATKSVPIKMQSKMRDTSMNSYDQNIIHRRSSAPCVYDSPTGDAASGGCGNYGPTTADFGRCRSRPPDYVDPKDQHLWRAKYCVLEEGVLYFYRTKDEAEAQEAKQERQSSLDVFDSGRNGGNISNNNGNSNGGGGYCQGKKRMDVADLSKSPMPSRTCLILPSVDGSYSGGSNSDAESTFMWEKRVALNCVGAVRSAESEYGINAFELLAVDDDDEEGYTNKLVLKAPKQEEMNEWIFQFHRSLASFVMNMVDLVGASRAPSYALGDIHHPGFVQAGAGVLAPARSFNAPTFSPRYGRNMPNPSVASLSHGHGRSQLRRRRPDFAGVGLSTGGSVHSVPTITGNQSPTQFSMTLSNNVVTASNLVTPLKRGDLWLPEPEVLRSHQEMRQAMEERPPELSAPTSANPETERPPAPPVSADGKYVPPHLRKSVGKYVPPSLRKNDNDGGSGKPAPGRYLPPHMRNKNKITPEGASNLTSNTIGPRALSPDDKESIFVSKTPNRFGDNTQARLVSGLPKAEAAFRLGGCADPLVIDGSILDHQYIAKKASRVGHVHTSSAHGSLGGRKESAIGTGGTPFANNNGGQSVSLEWEIGAVSECGIRDSNEDAFFVTNDVLGTFGGMLPGKVAPTYWDGASNHQSGLFSIFDGHCGNQAARFAAERFPHFLYEASLVNDEKIAPALTEEIMRQAITKLDQAFCRLCVEDGREWESGSTALIAMLANDHLVIANIGDCRGVLCRTFVEGDQQPEKLDKEKWSKLIIDHDGPLGPKCFWREVTDVHSPSRKDEKERIEKAGGWTTTETEIPISQLQRMDFLDQDVVDILRRCFQDRINDSNGSKACSSAPQRILQIHRVCGELAVSRAIGDRDFKAACNMPLSADTVSDAWETSLFLPYPDGHDRQFVGDLVCSAPDFQSIRVGERGIQQEFLVLACDGLWDVMDQDDAVRVAHDLLFNKQYSAKQAAARLAELAIHLGSSDNITVIVIRFFAKDGIR